MQIRVNVAATTLLHVLDTHETTTYPLQHGSVLVVKFRKNEIYWITGQFLERENPGQTSQTEPDTLAGSSYCTARKCGSFSWSSWIIGSPLDQGWRHRRWTKRMSAREREIEHTPQ